MFSVKLMGGMGNQMFQYALGRSLSIRNNTNLCVDLNFYNEEDCHRNYYLDIFELEVEVCSKVNKSDKAIKQRQWAYDDNILKIKSGGYIDGYWQSPQYFEGIKDVIRKDFRFKKELSTRGKELQQYIFSTNSVCLNIRLTDYVGHPLLGVCDMDYFINAVDYMNEHIDMSTIFVFSDDIEWCKNNLKSHDKYFFVDHSYAHSCPTKKFDEYFQLMVSCENYIIPNSTFAWWAVWLNEKSKIVIAPQRWFIPDDMDGGDLYFEKWVKI